MNHLFSRLERYFLISKNLFDPAVEGDPYETERPVFKKNDVGKYRTPLFKRKFSLR